MARPALRRQVVDYVKTHYAVAERRACRVMQQHRGTQRYQSTKDPCEALRHRLRELAQRRVRYGYRRLTILLRREGFTVGKHRIYRLYREEGLVLRRRPPRRRKMVVARQARHRPRQPNEAWSLDFVSDQLLGGERFRALTVIDVFSREALAIAVGSRLRATHVVDVLNGIAARRSAPKFLFADNGAEFSGQLMDLWGRITTTPASTSAGPASPQTMRLSRLSTGRSVTSA